MPGPLAPLVPLVPLRGRLLVDLSRYAPGPYCTLVCAALGADVVKVEPPGTGDPLRELDLPAFERLNRGKRSIAIDLKSSEGAGVLHRLVRTADVLVEGFRPGALSRLGLDLESLREEAPALLCVSITGYGQSGPYRDRAGHDVNYMALAGALHGASGPLPLQVADFAAGGLFAVVAILAALLERESSGVGRHLDLSMHHGVLSLLMLASGEAGDRLSGRYPNYGLYRARDGGMLSVGALEPKFWRAFCGAIGRADLESRAGDPEAREEVAAVIGERDLGHWEKTLAGVDACAEGVLPPSRARSHPQARHRGADRVELTLPFHHSAVELGAAPGLGEHTDEILGGLGYSRAAIERLHAKGVC